MNVAALLIGLSALAAEPTAEQHDLLKTFRSEFVSITPGEGKFPKSFHRGSADGSANERPVQEVTFGYSFHVAKYEVPQNLWQAVIGKNPSRWQGKRNSVEMLNFEEAIEFCRQATVLMRAAKLIETDEVIRLPTEAEWEYVARAGTKTKYSFGDGPANLGRYAWYTGNAAGNDPAVGAKEPNPWGLYDIHGYLWEWCQDHWHDSYESAPRDGAAFVGGTETRYVARSGSWKDKAEQLTSTYRRAVEKTVRDDAIGLRCVLSKEKGHVSSR